MKLQICPELKNLKKHKIVEYTDPKEAEKFSYPPKGEGNAEYYSISLKENCPVNPITIFNLTFMKGAHEPRRQGQVAPPEPVLLTCKMTKNQFEALNVKAKAKIIKWREKDGKRAVLKSAPASDFIVIEKLPPGEYENTVKIRDINKTLMSDQSLVQHLAEKEEENKKLREELEELKKKAEKEERDRKHKNKGK